MSERTKMREVAERILAGTPAPVNDSDPPREAAAARRQLADLSRVLRAAHRHGHGVGSGHQRGVRVHVDAHQPVEGPPARRRAWWPSTGPSRRSATSSNPEYKANREAAPDILRQQMGLVREVLDALRDHVVELGRWEADDIIATVAEQAKADGHDVIIVTGDRDSYQLVDDPAREGALQPPRRQRLRAVRRGRHRREDRRDAGAVPAVRRAARRPERQPAGRARRRGEDGGEARSTPTAGSTASSPTSTSRPRSCAHRLPNTRRGCGSNTELMVLRRDAPIEVDLSTLTVEPDRRAEVRRLFDFLEFRVAARSTVRGTRRRPAAQRPSAEPAKCLEAEVTDGCRSGRRRTR